MKLCTFLHRRVCGNWLRLFVRYSSVRHRSRVSTGNPWGGNLILMGCPGCGKTTVGGILSGRLGLRQIDIDNDHLEPLWGTAVGNKLDELGDDAFLEAEGRALLGLNVSNRIISLTGSNPLHKAAMEKLRATGTVVYIDVPIQSILSRLHQMKTDRIVGLKAGQSMADVLRYRLQFYEVMYDVRVLVGEDDTCETIADMIQERLLGEKRRNGYVSTRANLPETNSQDEITRDFAQVTREGFAKDGGLYVPYYKLPNSTLSEWERLVDMNYQDRGLRILQRWINREMDTTTLRSMLDCAYNNGTFESDEICPVRHLSDNQYVVELFRGPTASFKDLALQLMPQFFRRSVQSNAGAEKDRHLILVATSGDTGGAVLDGFSRHVEDSDIAVMVLYPEVGVSGIQKAQMTSMNGPLTKVIGVNGDFDFCQSTIKQIFRDPDVAQDLRKSHNCYLSAANSISWARLLPQVIFHCSAYLDLVRQGAVQLGQPVHYCIPTGNFGNILAAFYAKSMGIPFGRLTAACNVNNVVSEFVRTGHYDLTSRALTLTASPAIDILKSSNLERYLWHAAGQDGAAVRALYSSLDHSGFFRVPEKIQLKLQKDFSGGWCSEEDCLATIRSTFHKTGYILDPHTAVAKAVADRAAESDRPTLIAATAHCGKFADVVLSALGHDVRGQDPASMLGTLSELSPTPGIHERLWASLQSPAKAEPLCEATPRAVINRIKQFLSSF